MSFKDKIHDIVQYYGDKNRNIPIFNKKEWEEIHDMDKFNVEPRDGDIELHNFEEFDEEKYFNGVIKNPITFDHNKKEIEYIYSDYYTYKSLKEVLTSDIRNYPRELASIGNIAVCISIGVTNTLISKRNPKKFLTVRRSDEVGVYPNMNAVTPSGGVDDNHENLNQCCEEEFEEEVGVDCKVDFKYNGAVIDLYSLSLNISGIGVIEDLSLSEVKDRAEKNAEDDFEFSNYKIEDFSNLELKYDKYNTTPPALYSMLRAEETKEKIL